MSNYYNKFKILSSIFIILLTLSSCTNTNKKNVQYVLKTNYDLEKCKKKTYTNDDLLKYKNLVKQGEIQGFNCIGIYYIKAKQDYKKAQEYFKKGIKAGSIESYYQLGSLYSTFMKKDFKDIIKAYKQAANKGHTLAMHNLGVQYYNQAKFKDAIYWYTKSANSGDNYSLEALGHTYRMKGDLEKARQIYLKLGLEKKDPQGYKNLGIFYSKNNKYKDLKKSDEYFLKCFELGKVNCAASIAQGYEEKKDYKNAIKWGEKGFEAGSTRAVQRLALLYIKLKDYDKAIYWYKRCYKELDYLNCSLSLGIVYKDLKDYKNAIKWYKIGHERGDYRATQNLGYLYEKHLKDYKNAIIWYKKALKTKNYKKAKRGLKRLKKLGVFNE